ncbi:MAG: hypothetical protein ACKO7R_10135 [Pseudanabaena sp.]
MQVTEKPVSTEQTEQVEAQVIEKVPEKESDLLSINAQVSFASLLALIQTLPKEQKWQIYQALGAELAPQSAASKAIARLADEDDESKWITVIEEGEEVDVDASLEYLKNRGYKVEVPAKSA